MITHLTNDQILKFIFNKLSPTENSLVENFLLENDEYRIAVNELLDLSLNNKWSESDLQDHLLLLNPVSQQTTNKRRTRKIIPFIVSSISAVAAAVILLLSLNSGVEAIILDHNAHANPVRDTTLLTAEMISIYNDGEFKKLLIQNYNASELNDIHIRLHLGLSALQLRKPDLKLAAYYLAPLTDYLNIYQKDALWYMAQINQLSKDDHGCMEYLQELEAIDPNYKWLPELQEKCQ